MGQLDNRRALITGAGRGMGRSHAKLFAAEGAQVIVQDIDAKLAQETVAIITASGGQADLMVGDVAEVQTLKTQIAAAGDFDILVNNAGIDRPGHLEDIDEQAFDEMFNVHVKGSFFAAQAVVGSMKKNGWGRIINISSIFGMVAHTSRSHYCGAKAALLGLTKAWAKELAPYNINVNAVAPGGVWTEMELEKRGAEGIREAEKLVPLGRWAQPEELSQTVLFLASEHSGFITGQCISPNGGAVIV